MGSAEVTTDAAVLDVAAVRAALVDEGLDGWLLYDFHGSNPIATRLTGVDRGAHLTTRRWYYLIPRDGEPRALVHAIESRVLAHLPGSAEKYAARHELEAGLQRLLTGVRRVAMEFSPHCAIPILSASLTMASLITSLTSRWNSWNRRKTSRLTR